MNRRDLRRRIELDALRALLDGLWHPPVPGAPPPPSPPPPPPEGTPAYARLEIEGVDLAPLLRLPFVGPIVKPLADALRRNIESPDPRIQAHAMKHAAALVRLALRVRKRGRGV